MKNNWNRNFVEVIIIIIITRMIFMVLSSWQSHCESSSSSFDECRLSTEVAANPQTKPTDLDCESSSNRRNDCYMVEDYLVTIQQ